MRKRATHDAHVFICGPQHPHRNQLGRPLTQGALRNYQNTAGKTDVAITPSVPEEPDRPSTRPVAESVVYLQRNQRRPTARVLRIPDAMQSSLGIRGEDFDESLEKIEQFCTQQRASPSTASSAPRRLHRRVLPIRMDHSRKSAGRVGRACSPTDHRFTGYDQGRIALHPTSPAT